MLKSILENSFHGFCMALADSVPGVSGGTVAFIMGFYDDFIGSVHDIVFGDFEKKKKAFFYLVKLGAGWVIGMALAVLLLSALFENHIYAVSSLFIGLVAGSFPVIIREEKQSVKLWKQGLPCGIAGAVIVVGITWLNGRVSAGGMDLHTFQPVACLAGGLLVALMEFMKERGKKNGTRNS